MTTHSQLIVSAFWIFISAASLASAFTGIPPPKNSGLKTSTTKLFYDIQRDPPNDNVWSILTNTEKWISSTLQDAQQGGNPLSRKEVSYVCETSKDIALVLANIFRKLKEARLIGEDHGQEQEELVQSSCKLHFLHRFLIFANAFKTLQLIDQICKPRRFFFLQRPTNEQHFAKRKFWSYLPTTIYWTFKFLINL